MESYTLEVTAGAMMFSGTLDSVYVTLIGSEGMSDRTQLGPLEEKNQKEGTFTVVTLLSLGCLLLLKVEKDPHHEDVEKDWFCSKIRVWTPEGDHLLFPCYTWLSRGEHVVLRQGTATKALEDQHPRLKEQRRSELAVQKSLYKWERFADGYPSIINAQDPRNVPVNIRFSFTKLSQFLQIVGSTKMQLKMKGLLNSTDSWESFEAMKNISWFSKSAIGEYMADNWKSDEMLGFQFLNIYSPLVIRRCVALPSNFPVTEEMVKPFLARGRSLAEEIDSGNIFIVDLRVTDGLPTQVLDGQKLVLSAPLCLFYLHPENKMLPIAIQLGQQPSATNPIFLPSDSESDWLLAKTFFRHAAIIYSAIVGHFLDAHQVSESFAISTLRNLPRVHPLHKLLMPHHRYTLHINILGRATLLGDEGLFANSSLGGEGQFQLMRRAMAQNTYTTFCLPDNLAARGLMDVPDFYFRDDGLRLWSSIHRFVQAVVGYYYPLDSEVSSDSELQQWINEIFHYGFLGNASLGFPSSFKTTAELIKFVTMVIYRSSAGHAMVSNTQADLFGWIPNAPTLLHRPPPTAKGHSSMKDILPTLPNKFISSSSLFAMRYQSFRSDDFVSLGSYPNQRFEEPAVLQMIKDFQEDLSAISDDIVKRNMQLKLPYNYLNPVEIENSVAV
ncbi:arachidonate 12-lipoxygenase, 12R-type-like [Synchiropus splendidus]|uniref:arachidonate 12-lipoxygenase, 12R-type-like n=1 Tax=Synchiropus splendidus TaxID=270530 RepID=UPI00237E7BDB|nr:arachidonate 12-lipoxygenase, 12R-type-like [Synchiropus splendidus]